MLNTSRPGSPLYVSNQSITGALARSGLDPDSLAGSAAWLALSATAVTVAAIGMRRVLSGGEPALALSLNALAALLISPISWSHHWVWAAPALLCLAVTGRRHHWPAGIAAAWTGFVLFTVSPLWLLPHGGNREPGWGWWEQVIGDSYVIFGAVVLVLAARARCRPSPMPPEPGAVRGARPARPEQERVSFARVWGAASGAGALG